MPALLAIAATAVVIFSDSLKVAIALIALAVVMVYGRLARMEQEEAE